MDFINRWASVIGGVAFIAVILAATSFYHSYEDQKKTIAEYEIKMQMLEQSSQAATKKAEEAAQRSLTNLAKIDSHIDKVEAQKIAPDCSSVRAFLLQQAKALNK